MAETATMVEMLAALKEAIATAKSLSGGPAGHEPAYRYLGDPPGRAVTQAYLQERQPPEPKSQALPVFYVELPPLVQERSPLVEVLSKALDLPMNGKWQDRLLAEERLAEQLRARQVELVIIADAHHLIGRPLAVEWLVSFFKQHLNHVPLLLVGESKLMDDLLLWSAWCIVFPL
jgi:AAA domain